MIVTTTSEKPIAFAAWNVRTLLDNPKADRPERRTALIDKELQRTSIAIVALSETRFSDEGSLVEQAYTFFWKGLPEGEIRQHGVGFAIRNDLAAKLTENPVGISERLMTLRFPAANNTFVNIIAVYAPTLNSSDNLKDTFYETLVATLSKIPKRERIILLGDFNARVGRGQDSELWPGIIGKHGTDSINSNENICWLFVQNTICV